MGKIQVVDSVHTVADVDHDADRLPQAKGQAARDPQAQLVSKDKRRKTGPDGTVSVHNRHYLGYKSHVSLNAATGLITTIEPTGGSAADNEQFPKLLPHDQQVGVAAETYSGHKAYDDTDQHYRLWQQGKHSALRLNNYRTGARNAHRDAWQQVKDSPSTRRGWLSPTRSSASLAKPSSGIASAAVVTWVCCATVCKPISRRWYSTSSVSSLC